MAEHRTVKVLVADNWGSTPKATPGTAFGTNFALGPSGYITAPAGGGGDIGPGDLIAINNPSFTPYVLPGAPGANIQRSYNDTYDRFTFATYDATRGLRTSELIEYDRIDRVQARYPELRKPHVWVFHLAFNEAGAGVPVKTPRGTLATVRVSADRSYRDINKRDFFAEWTVGEAIPTPPGTIAAPVPATDAEIQRAHYEILRQILAADPDGLFFDKASSLALSNAVNYTSVVLVGALRRVFNLDRYAEFRNVILDVSLVRGFYNPTFIGNVDTAGDITAYTTSLTAGTYSAFSGTWVTPDQGNGYPDQVTWNEAQHMGQDGHTNHVLWAIERKLFARENRLYTFAQIDFHNKYVVTGEGSRKNQLKSVMIYLAYSTAQGVYLSPIDFDWRYGSPSAVVDPFFVPGTISVAQWTAPSLSIPTPFGNTVGVAATPQFTNFYNSGGVIVLPAQAGGNALFYAGGAITGTQADFLNNASNQLFT